MTRGRTHCTLSIAVTGDEPPSEFCIFTAGKVETTKGSFLFDAKAAESVMAEYTAHGTDIMLDYDHASLSPLTLDPAQAGKAAGWCNLEVRGGELWAVNVRWTPPAAEALKRKEWRYMSPAFNADDAGRITSLLNVAITNLPATRRLEPLMAANLTTMLGENGMTLEEFLKVVKALGIDMSTPLDEAMAKIKGEGDPDATTEDAPPPVGDGGADEKTEPAAMKDDPKPEDPAAVAASVSRLTRITGKTSIGEAVEEVETWRLSHLALTAETAKLAKERAALEANERDALTVEIALAMSPAIAWADPIKATDRAKRKPAEPFASMAIVELRGFASKLKASRGSKPAPVVPPAKGAPAGDVPGESKTFTIDGQPVTLDARELKICAESKCAPETFAMLKARRASHQRA